MTNSWINHKIGSPEEPLTSQKLVAYQLEKLQQVVDWVCKNSPFYRQHLQGNEQRRFRSLADFADLPFLTADHIQEQGFQMMCVGQEEVERANTSGTTGQPKRIYFTGDDQELTIDFFYRAMATFTKEGDRVFIMMPGERPGSIGNLLAIALKRIGAIPIQHGVVYSLPKTLQRIIAEQADVLVGIPIQALALAKYYERYGRKVPLALRRMVLSADYVSQAIIKEIRRILNCEVFDHYGMTEMGFGVGIDCSFHQGYHLRDADLYVEVIDPQTGVPVPEGQLGELVFTTLTRQGMPMIRYRSGDLSRFQTSRCSCGTVLHTLDYIRARKDSGAFLDEGCYLTIAELDEALLGLPGIVDFSATISFKKNWVFLILEVKIFQESEKLKEQDIHSVLRQISSIAAAEQRNTFKIVIDFTYCTHNFIPLVGKRTLSFRR